MGTANSTLNVVRDNPNREVFISVVSHELIGGYVVYRFVIKYRKFRWELDRRFHEFQKLDRELRRHFPDEIRDVIKPPRYPKLFYKHDEEFLKERGNTLCAYLQKVCDSKSVFHGPVMQKFLDLGATSFTPEFGRKGKEGWLSKCSGGYIMNFSRRPGDFVSYWRRRWFVLHDNYVAWYRYREDREPRGVLQLDSSLDIVLVGRVLSIRTNTRKLTISASTRREAEEWTRALHAFYKNTPRRLVLPFHSSFPPRNKTDVRVYTFSKDYMAAAAVAILGAQKEIFISSWKNSPCVLLTRPPFPTVRMDQALRFKAEQGVKIYILLYKEVEMAGQGNDSGKAQNYLESLSPNIKCVRHPNKFMGGSTAVLWSHHEKLLVVDRNIAFVGGIDLAFNRWDDMHHRVEDEDGLMFPGRDYRQPAEGMFKPVRVLTQEGMSGNRMENAAAAKRRSSAGFLGITAMQEKFYEQSLAISAVDAAYQNKLTEQDASTATAVTATSLAAASGSSSARAQRVESSDKMSEASVHIFGSDDEPNRNEDKDEPLTAEELAARAAAEEDARKQACGSPAPLQPSELDLAAVTELNAAAEGPRSPTGTAENAASGEGFSITAAFKKAKESLGALADSFNDNVSAISEVSKLEVRETFPRMAWHDCQASVSGSAARDVASHIVQRWNHHRLATNNADLPVLRDITDDTSFGVCAKCDLENILESCVSCPRCGHSLGPINAYIAPMLMGMLPRMPHSYSYISFECMFAGQYGFKILGEGPVVVTGITSIVVPEDMVMEGKLLQKHGASADKIIPGLLPAVGDVVVSVDGSLVTHLDYLQVARLIVRRRMLLNNERLAIVFRRFHLVDSTANTAAHNTPLEATTSNNSSRITTSSPAATPSVADNAVYAPAVSAYSSGPAPMFQGDPFANAVVATPVSDGHGPMSSYAGVAVAASASASATASTTASSVAAARPAPPVTPPMYSSLNRNAPTAASSSSSSSTSSSSSSAAAAPAASIIPSYLSPDQVETLRRQNAAQAGASGASPTPGQQQHPAYLQQYVQQQRSPTGASAQPASAAASATAAPPSVAAPERPPKPQTQAQAQTGGHVMPSMPSLPDAPPQYHRAVVNYGSSMPAAPTNTPLVMPVAPTNAPVVASNSSRNPQLADMQSYYADRTVAQPSNATSGNRGASANTSNSRSTTSLDAEEGDNAVLQRSRPAPSVVTVEASSSSSSSQRVTNESTLAQGPKPANSGLGSYTNSGLMVDSSGGNANQAGAANGGSGSFVQALPIGRPPPIWGVSAQNEGSAANMDDGSGASKRFFDRMFSGNNDNSGGGGASTSASSVSDHVFEVTAASGGCPGGTDPRLSTAEGDYAGTYTHSSTHSSIALDAGSSATHPAMENIRDTTKALHNTIQWAIAQRSQAKGDAPAMVTRGNGSGGGLSIASNGTFLSAVDGVCAMAAKMELHMSMSYLFHESAKYAEIANRASETGSCQVQVLRSVGPWSLGIPVENSIMQCWADSIRNAKHLVYIENQFFISSLGGSEIQNPLAEVILERIVRAFNGGEVFRVIILLPQHPNGDVAFKDRPRIVLHYESMTINKGINSLVQQLKRRLPGVNPSEYLDFFCLRSWGTMNGKIVHDQIYVHDKVLIVDDRIAIIGSANINDRSMLGDRDTEMAIRIEDTRHMTITLAGRPWVCGQTVHNMRLQMMRQHVAWSSSRGQGDMVDVVRPEGYLTSWRNVAANNSALYDQLDGDSSPYRCKTLVEYTNGLRDFVPKSCRDPLIQHIVGSIQGFLVMWPLDFLIREDTSPSTATKVIVPTNLWV